MEGTRTISVFVGSSRELAHDQRVLSDFFAEVNRITLEQGVFFSFIAWQWDGRNDPLRDYAQMIRGSSLCLFLYFTTAGDLMERQFDEAMRLFRAQGTPQIITWFKVLPDGVDASDELVCFKEHLDTQLHHFYNVYDTVDTVKLGLLLQIARNWGAEEGILDDMGQRIAVRNDVACLFGTPLVNLKGVPAYRDWYSLQSTQEELATISIPYERARARVLEDASDVDAQEQLRILGKRKQELERTIAESQQRFLDVMGHMTQVQAGIDSLTERQKQAYRLVGLGKLNEAIEMLDERAIDADCDRVVQALRLADAQRENLLHALRATVEEKLQLADLLYSKPQTVEIARRIEKLMTEAAQCERDYRLGYRAQLALGRYEMRHHRFAPARRGLQGALDWLEAADRDEELERAYISAQGSFCDLLLFMADTKGAETANRKLGEYLAERHASWGYLRACCANGYADALRAAGKFDEAERTAQNSLRLWEELPASTRQNTGGQQAKILSSLAATYRRQGERYKSAWYSQRAITVLRSLVSSERVSHVDQRGLALELCYLSQDQLSLGDVDQALVLIYEASEMLARLCKDDLRRYLPDYAYVVHNVGLAQWEKGLHDYAVKSLEFALSLRRSLYQEEPKAFAQELSTTLYSLGWVYEKDDDIVRAERMFVECEQLRYRLFESDPRAYAEFDYEIEVALAYVHRRQEAWGPAAECSRRAIAAGAYLGSPSSRLASQWWWLAVCEGRLGNREEQIQCYKVALEQFEALGDNENLEKCRENLRMLQGEE